MPRSLPPLTSLRTFEAAARLGGFARAARELHVTPAAVSHQIRSLEEYLGVTLFHRTTRRLVMTEQAAAAADSLREAFDRIGQGVELMRSSGQAGALTVGTSPAFATRWLVGRLPHFQKQHPRIQLRIKASPTPVDFDQEDVDLDVRIGRGGFEGVRAIKLFHEWIAPVAAPALLRLHPLRRPADVTRAALLHDDSLRRAGRLLGWQDWLRLAGVAPPDGRQGIHFDDGHLALQAAVAGGGVALGRLVYAVDDLVAKRLRIALRPVIRMDFAYYLLIPESRLTRPAVAAFRAWIEAEASAFRRSFERLIEGGAKTARRARTPRRTDGAK